MTLLSLISSSLIIVIIIQSIIIIIDFIDSKFSRLSNSTGQKSQCHSEFGIFHVSLIKWYKNDGKKEFLHIRVFSHGSGMEMHE